MAVTKRYSAPAFWGMRLKEKKFAVSPVPGPHSKAECIPLGVILRDLLGHARTMKEARGVLLGKAVKVNGSARKEHNFPVGLMDVVDIGGDFYRVVPCRRGLRLLKTDAADAATRLAKITNKTHTKKKRLQLNFHDGSNMLVDKDDFRSSDVVAIDISSKAVRETIKFEKGSFAVVTGGNNSGLSGTIESVDRRLRTVVMGAGGTKLIVPVKYVFVVGRQQPLVRIGEQDENERRKN